MTKKTKLFAFAVTAYEDGDPTADHNYIAFMQTRYIDFTFRRDETGFCHIARCDEYAITDVTITTSDLFACFNEEGCIADETFRDTDMLDPKDCDTVIRELITDEFYNRDTEADRWQAMFDTMKIGPAHDLSNPF